MSRSCTRFLATSLLAALAITTAAAGGALAASPSERPDGTWVQLAALPEILDAPVFALAVNPTDRLQVLVGTGSGSIYRTTDGGLTWFQTAKGAGRGIVTIAFSPLKAGLVLAGTRGDGTFRSADAGITWARLAGIPPGTTRSFGFAKTVTLAGTDSGVFSSRDGITWTALGLKDLRVNAIAVAAINDPPRFLAGADASKANEALPLYQSPDGGVTWAPVKSLGSSTMIGSAMAYGGPLAAPASVRPLVVGTNAGAFTSPDNGGTWTQLAGLPNVDYNSIVYSATHPDRYYVASDGGGSDQGGLWATTDSGASFRGMATPLPSVTALGVSAEDVPTLYLATFRPLDHAVLLWTLRDTGGRPLLPAAGVPAPVLGPVGVATTSTAPTGALWQRFLRGPEAPYLAVSALALLILLMAGVAYLRRGDKR